MRKIRGAVNTLAREVNTLASILNIPGSRTMAPEVAQKKASRGISTGNRKAGILHRTIQLTIRAQTGNPLVVASLQALPMVPAVEPQSPPPSPGPLSLVLRLESEVTSTLTAITSKLTL